MFKADFSAPKENILFGCFLVFFSLWVFIFDPNSTNSLVFLGIGTFSIIRGLRIYYRCKKTINQK